MTREVRDVFKFRLKDLGSTRYKKKAVYLQLNNIWKGYGEMLDGWTDGVWQQCVQDERKIMKKRKEIFPERKLRDLVNDSCRLQQEATEAGIGDYVAALLQAKLNSLFMERKISTMIMGCWSLQDIMRQDPMGCGWMINAVVDVLVTGIGLFCAGIGQWFEPSVGEGDDEEEEEDMDEREKQVLYRMIREVMNCCGVSEEQKGVIKRIATGGGLFCKKQEMIRERVRGISLPGDVDFCEEGMLTGSEVTSGHFSNAFMKAGPERTEEVDFEADIDQEWKSLVSEAVVIAKESEHTPLRFLKDMLDCRTEKSIWRPDERGKRCLIPGMPDPAYVKLARSGLAAMKRIKDEEGSEKVRLVFGPTVSALRAINYTEESEPDDGFFFESKGGQDFVYGKDVDVMMYYWDQGDPAEAFRFSDLCMTCGTLDPLESHLMRLLVYCIVFYNSTRLDNEEAKRLFGLPGDKDNDFFVGQLRNTIACLRTILFPLTSYDHTMPMTMLFVHSVFGALCKRLRDIRRNQGSADDGKAEELQVGAKFERAFTSEIEAIAPAVFDNLSKIGWEASGKDSKDSTHFSLGIPTIVSRALQRVQFLLSPQLRRQCPVTYTYLRVFERFSAVKKMKTTLNVLDGDSLNHEEDDDEDFVWTFYESMVSPFTAGIRDVFDGEWNDVRSRAEGISKTWEEDYPQKPYKSAKLALLEEEIRGYNDFIGILSQASAIEYEWVQDTRIGDDDGQLEDRYGNDLALSVADSLNPSGDPQFDWASERDFVESLSRYSYQAIWLESLNPSNIPDATTQTTEAVFSMRFKVLPLSPSQKASLFTRVVQAHRSEPVLEVCRYMMQTLVDQASSGQEKLSWNVDDALSNISFTDGQLTPYQESGRHALNAASGAEQLMVGHLPMISCFLRNPSEFTFYETNNTRTCSDVIIDQVFSTARLSRELGINKYKSPEGFEPLDFSAVRSFVPRFFLWMMRDRSGERFKAENLDENPKGYLDEFKEKCILSESERLVLDRINLEAVGDLLRYYVEAREHLEKE